MILGSQEPLEFDIDRAYELFSLPALRKEFRAIEVETPYELLVFYRMDQEGVLKVSEGFEFNTDDNMRVEYSAPKQLYKSTGNANIRTLMESPQVPYLETIHQSLEMAEAYGAGEDWVRGMIVLREVLERDPDNVEAGLLWNYYRSQFQKGQEPLESEEG